MQDRLFYCLMRSLVAHCLCRGLQTDLPGLSLWIPPAAVWIGCGSAADVSRQWSERCEYALHWLWRTPPWRAASPTLRHVPRAPRPWSWCSALCQKTQHVLRQDRELYSSQDELRYMWCCLPLLVSTLICRPRLWTGLITHRLLVAVMSNSSQPSSAAHSLRESSKKRSASLGEH